MAQRVLSHSNYNAAGNRLKPFDSQMKPWNETYGGVRQHAFVVSGIGAQTDRDAGRETDVDSGLVHTIGGDAR